MGVWTENLSLPAVLNECLMQSYSGIIRVFPNTQNLGQARFHHLRAAGAFLVSAAWDGKQVTAVTLTSEKGAVARIANPWPNRRVTISVPHTEKDGIIEFATQPGVTYSLHPSGSA